MTWEIIATIAIVTAVRTFWMAIRPLPHDVQPAIMSGLQRIRRVLSGEVKVEGNAPYGLVWYGINLPFAKLAAYDGRRWMIALALVFSLFLWRILRDPRSRLARERGCQRARVRSSIFDRHKRQVWRKVD